MREAGQGRWRCGRAGGLRCTHVGRCPFIQYPRSTPCLHPSPRLLEARPLTAACVCALPPTLPQSVPSIDIPLYSSSTLSLLSAHDLPVVKHVLSCCKLPPAAVGALHRHPAAHGDGADAQGRRNHGRDAVHRGRRLGERNGWRAGGGRGRRPDGCERRLDGGGMPCLQCRGVPFVLTWLIRKLLWSPLHLPPVCRRAGHCR